MSEASVSFWGADRSSPWPLALDPWARSYPRPEPDPDFCPSVSTSRGALS